MKKEELEIKLELQRLKRVDLEENYKRQ